MPDSNATPSQSTVEHFAGSQRDVLDEAADPVFIVSGEGRISYLNPAAIRDVLAGGDFDQLPDSDETHFWQLLDPHTPLPLIDRLKAAIANAQRWSGVLTLGHLQANAKKSFYCHLTPLSDGRLVWLTPLADVLAAMDTCFHWQRLESLGTLAGGISHDFNNLIAAIQGNAELAQRRLQNDDAVRHLLDNILVATAAAHGLSEQILSFSRDEPISRSRLDLVAVVRDAVRLLDVSIPRHIDCSLDLPSSPLYMSANASQLIQVIVNLGVNALQAIEKDKGRFRIGIRAEEDAWVRIEVEDDGKGIAEQHLTRIFDPFFTTNSENSGTGLGLVMVQRIVNQYGGTIDVSSEVNKGTLFALRFPLEED